MDTSNLNPYEILGLPANAPKIDIKRAYRQMAKKFHPDHNKNDREAEDQFKKIAEAYETLSNEKYGFRQAIKKLISQLKQELNEHLDSINENTNEIHSNYEYIQELDQKIEKLKLRLDNVELFLSEKASFTKMQKEKISVKLRVR